MGIFNRIATVFRSNVNAALDKLSDPSKEIDLLVLDMEDQLTKSKEALRDQLTQEKLLQRKVDQAYSQIDKLKNTATHAVELGNDELARQVLREIRSEEVKLADLEKLLVRQSQIVLQATEQIRFGEQKYSQIKANKETLKLQARSLKTASGAIDNDAFEKFEKLVEQIEFVEASAEASADIAALNSGQANQSARLLAGKTAEVDIETKLLELKAASKSSES